MVKIYKKIKKSFWSGETLEEKYSRRCAGCFALGVVFWVPLMFFSPALASLVLLIFTIPTICFFSFIIPLSIYRDLKEWWLKG